MTLLSGIRNLITRRRSTLTIDLPGPESDAHDEIDPADAEAEPREEVEMMEAVELQEELVPRAEVAAEAAGAEVVVAAESLGDQLAAHGKRLDAHGDRLAPHGGKLDAHGERLDAHGGKLQVHGEQLQAHRGQVEAHGGQLGEHRERLDAHAEQMSVHGSHLDGHAGQLDAHGGQLAAHGGQLQQQTALVQKLTEELQERLPHVLEETAQIKSMCGQVVDLVSAQATEAQGREDAVTEAVNEAVRNAVAAGVKRLGDASSHDAAMLDRIQKELESNTQAIRAAGETDEGTAHRLREVLELTVKLQRAVATLEQSAEGHSAQVAAKLAATKRSMMMLAFACALASVTALVIAVLALVT